MITDAKTALEEAEKLIRESIEHYQGRNRIVKATTGNDHGRVLDLLREALDMPAYVPPWEQEAEWLNEALVPLSLEHWSVDDILRNEG